MKLFGIIILIVGIILGIYAFSMETSVEVNYRGYSYGLPNRVSNLSLMNKQRNLLIFSGILSLTGLIIIFASMSMQTNNNKEIVETHKMQQKVQDPNSQQKISSIADDLKKIKELLDTGVINQEEFDKMKNRLIDSLDKSTNLVIRQKEIKSNDIYEQNEKHIDYTVPGYKIINQIEESTFFGSRKEKYLIKFEDGESGEVYEKLNNKQAYYKDKKQYDWVTVKHYYENFDFCITALHYYLKTGKLLNEGYIESYS